MTSASGASRTRSATIRNTLSTGSSVAITTPSPTLNPRSTVCPNDR